MIRIRFHGRGGHGIKTAGRIAGTAAFLAGLQVQDSPVYGAERRGAAVTAFTRIDQQPILERGTIDSPDLILIGDETLLDDRGAAVLLGHESAAAVFINVASAEGLSAEYGIRVPAVACDITERTRQTLGKPSALSAGLGAAAARLAGLIAVEHVVEAVRQELQELNVAADVVERNVLIARDVFQTLSPVEFARQLAPGRVPAMHTVAYDAPAVGTPSIVAPGNAAQRMTGMWRVERPEVDYDICTRCGLCVVGCPDGAISLDEEGYPVMDYPHCKGCMICAQLCPLHAIGKTKEVRAW
jgi:pyruvate ferredoxin oxidoreductase gamma subunit